MKQFSDTTQAIINKHKADFNCKNYSAKLKAAGGYSGYLKGLGGVFAKYNGKTASVKTVSELHEIAEYVFGLMSIYGFDYNNGKIYRRWAGGSPFYVDGKKGRSNWGRIDDLCGKSTKAKTTNCNYGMDSLLYKAGLYGGKGQPTNSCAYKSHINKRKFKFTRKKSELRVGDLIQFFRDPVTSDNPSAWSRWGHVAIVGAIKDGKVYCFDSGGRFITTGNYIHEFKVDSANRPTGDYSAYKGWAATRTVSIKSAPTIYTKDAHNAVAIIHGDFGSGSERKETLGKRYDAAQNLVDRYLTAAGHADYIRACADFVLCGYAGKGDDRKEYFGGVYAEVQAKVDWIIKTAKEVWAGKYGTDRERESRLGADYQVVQEQVNRTKA